MEFRVGVISGDGIGPEIVREARKVLDQVGEKFGHHFIYEEILMGGCSIDAIGIPLSDEAIEAAKASDAVLMDPSAEIPPHLPGTNYRRRNGRRRDS